MGYYDRAKEVLFSPRIFFDKLKKETGLGVSIKYLLIMLVLNSLLLVLVAMLVGSNSSLSQQNPLTEYGATDIALSGVFGVGNTALFLGFFIGSVVVGFIVSFIYALFLLMWLNIFRKGFGHAVVSYFYISFFWLTYFINRDRLKESFEGYEKAYQLFVYANTPTYVFGWIPFIGGFASIYYLVLMILGTEQIYGFTRKKAALLYLIPLLVIGLLMIIFLALGLAIFN